MLDSLRRHATGWVAKILFGFLVLSFAIWGIGDIFRAQPVHLPIAEHDRPREAHPEIRRCVEPADR